jgi:hypothetical protein
MKIAIRVAFLATFASYFDRAAGISHKIYCILSKKLLEVDRTEFQWFDSQLEDARASGLQLFKKYSCLYYVVHKFLWE